jgi:hypothetical protein
MAPPSKTTETAMASSTIWRGTSRSFQPTRPPTAIMATKVPGTVQMARPPMMALTIPTETMARR